MPLATLLDVSYYTLMILFVTVCVFMILLILIQKGRGGGLSGAFGGGSGHTAFGSKTGDVLTWATSIVFGVFLLLAVLLNLVANGMSNRNIRPTAPIGQPANPLVPPTNNPPSGR